VSRASAEQARGLIVRAPRTKLWHLIYTDRDRTIVTECGSEGPRGTWWMREVPDDEATCTKCIRRRKQRTEVQS
jgi:hypothetical protein